MKTTIMLTVQSDANPFKDLKDKEQSLAYDLAMRCGCSLGMGEGRPLKVIHMHSANPASIPATIDEMYTWLSKVIEKCKAQAAELACPFTGWKET